MVVAHVIRPRLLSGDDDWTDPDPSWADEF